MRYQFVFILFFLITPASVWGQQHYILAIKSDKKTSVTISNNLTRVDSVSQLKVLVDIRSQLHNQGFLMADFKNPIIRNDTLQVVFKLGQQFKLISLEPGNISKVLLKKIDFKEKYYQNKPFNPHKLNKLLKKIIVYSENNGFPFASVRLDSIGQVNEIFRASLNYKPGVHITFDTVSFDKKVGIKPFFLSHYLQISPGKPFQEKHILNTYEKLKRLPYIKIKSPAKVTFQNNQATLHLYIERKKANQIDGIIGILPNQIGKKKVLLTGQFDLQLHNLFSSGKGLSLKWQRLNTSSQFFHINYLHPNVLRSPLSFNIKFELHKEDTVFLNRSLITEFLFNKGNFGQYKFFAHSKTASLLGVNAISENQSITSLDFDLTTYGIGYDWVSLDDVFLPKAGTKINIEGAVGNKKIRKNANIATEVYDTIALSSIQYSLNINAEKYIKLGKKLVLSNHIRAGKILNKRLFRNDLFRIGGFKTLRGFNENFFYASEFVLANIELRYFFEDNSYFLLLYDQAFVGSTVNTYKTKDYPLGLGMGLNISTNAGIFRFIYALGKSREQTLSFSQSKIHFGYISKF